MRCLCVVVQLMQRPDGVMARPLRIEFPGALYHVTARGNERQPIYRNDTDRHRFLALLAEVIDQFQLLLHAYVLMDNHYHLLMETLDGNLRRAMRELNGTYAQAFNRGHRRVGHLFQGRYKALLVDRDTYLVELSRYLHLNPVRAGLVTHADQYRWSSAAAYVGNCAAPPFLTMAEVLGSFACRARPAHQHYGEFLRDAAGMRSRSPLEEVVAQTLLGDAAWVREMRARIDTWRGAERTDLKGNGEVPAVRQLRRHPTLEQVIAAVAAVTGVGAEAMRRPGRPCEARTVAIYLAYKSCGLPQHQIGAAFGIGRFAVSKTVASLRGDRLHNRGLAPLVQPLLVALRSAPATGS